MLPDGPHFCAWHQANWSVTAVACTAPPLMPIPGNLTISCPGLPGLAVGGGDGTLSAQCPATAAPDGVCTSANPHASGSAACAVPATPPASPSPLMATTAAVISGRPRPFMILIASSPVR